MSYRRFFVGFLAATGICLAGAVSAQVSVTSTATTTLAVPLASSTIPEVVTSTLPVATSTLPVVPTSTVPAIPVSPEEKIFPARPDTYIPIEGEFASAIVIRVRDKKVLYEYNADKKWVPASLTKLANALAYVSRNPNWGRSITLTSKDEVGGGRIRVNVGTRFTARDLFYASLTASANNAATALARSAGLTYAQFIARMNSESKKAGATASVFYDASGMNEKSQTTARDMSLIAHQAFKNPRIRAASTSAEYSLKVLNNGQVRKIKSTNELLIKEDNGLWVTGGKTGYLEESMYNLVTQVQPIGPDGKPAKKKEILVVVFGAPTKAGQFASVQRLAEWTWGHYEF